MSDFKTTHFGFQQVPEQEKQRRVGAVFDSVADRYDVMNDLMALGLHRVWKRFTRGVSGVREGHKVLDLAGGTGDLTRLFRERTGPGGQVILADINRQMLDHGRRKLIDQGHLHGVGYSQLNAEALPFRDCSFDVVVIGFGLRNVTHKDRALAEMFRVLRPGGRVLILEFSKLRQEALQPLYDLYSFKVLPWLGQQVTQDADSYRYLAESIRKHPDQEGLAQMMGEAGFEACEWFNLALGIVAVHRGFRL